jgi:hypothetical protein
VGYPDETRAFFLRLRLPSDSKQDEIPKLARVFIGWGMTGGEQTAMNAPEGAIITFDVFFSRDVSLHEVRRAAEQIGFEVLELTPKLRSGTS